MLALSPGAARAQGEAERLIAQADSLEKTDQPQAAFAAATKALHLLPATPSIPLVKAELGRCMTAAQAYPDSAMPIALHARAVAAQTGSREYAARTQLCYGYVQEAAGHNMPALAQYDSVVTIAREIHNNEVLADGLIMRGGIRYYRGEFNGAITDLNECYKLYGSLGNERRQVAALNEIANIYADSRVGEFGKALEYYRQVLASNLKTGSQLDLAATYFNLGSTLDQMGRYEDGLVQYRLGLAIDRKRGDADGVAEDERAIAVALYKLKRPQEGLPLLDHALAQFRKRGNEDMTARVRLSRGVTLRMLGRYDEAMRDLDAAREYNTATQNQRFLEKTEAERALALAAMGRWREAYAASAAQSALQRALSDSSRAEQTSRMRIEFDANKKEAENRALLKVNQMRGESLAAGARIRKLQAAVIAMSLLIAAALALFTIRQLRNIRRLRVTAMTDELTQLPNRRHLMLVANEQFKATRARGATLGVLALDIDHFKKINDTFGHPAGDAVLKRTAAAIQGALRAGDHVGRTGGEEFVIILPGANESVVIDVADRIRASIESADFSDVNADIAVTASVGAAVSAPQDASFSNLMKRADQSLYQAKEGGRNRVASAPVAAGA